MKFFIFLGSFLIIPLSQPLYAADDFSFDASVFEKQVLEVNGYVEGRLEHLSLDESAALYQLNFHDQPARSRLDRQTGTVELTGRVQQPDYLLQFTAHAEGQHDQLGSGDEADFYEAFLAYRTAPELTLEAGKRSFKWGKAYAWNLLGFVERPKDPNDPELSREGYTVLSADFIHSLDGPLQTVAFTPVYLPVTEDINSEYGQPEHNNVAAKLYLLYRDIDIDLAYLSNGSRADRIGMDFAANLSVNFELHGEWSYINGYTNPLTDASGNVTSQQADVHSYLLGLRYLTANDTTMIIEYYRNGMGYSAAQMSDYYQLIHHASETNNDSLLQQAKSLGQQAYTKRNPGRQYLYVRISNKEPFDILYFTPAITSIVNLDDDSYSLSPELLYTGVTNMELRFKATVLTGKRLTEFGEKQSDSRLEMRLRYHF